MSRKKTKTYDGEESIHSAVRAGDVEVVQELLRNSDASPNEQNRVGEGPLHVACQVDESVRVELPDRLSILQALWENGARMNLKGPRGGTPLHYAVDSQNVDVVNFLLNHGAHANVHDNYGRTPLHLVSAGASKDHSKNEAIFKLLLQNGANFHAQDTRHRTPLIEAVCNSNGEVVKLLLEAGAQIDFMNKLGLSAIFYACETQNVTMTRLLLEQHAKVRIRDQLRHSSPLHFVAGSGRRFTSGDDAANRSDVVARLLMASDVELDAEDREGSTPLHIAVDTKDERLVNALLQAGADVNAKDGYGNTPLHVLLLTARPVATRELDEERLERIAMLLVEKGARINDENNNLETPFHYSLYVGNPIVVSNFLKNGADIQILWHTRRGSLSFLHESPSCNSPEICGDSVEEAFIPLNVVATVGNLRVADLLLELHETVNIEAENSTGHHGVSKTPLYFAVKNGHYEIAKLFLDAGCKINRLVLHKTTVLHVAVSQGNAALVYLLLEYGADFAIKDIYGRTALCCAVEYGRESLVKIAKILVMYRSIREFHNSYTTEEDLKVIFSRKWLEDFRFDCFCELAKMRKHILNDNISMYTVISKDVESLAMCLGNSKIIDAFISENKEDKYPIYSDMLRIHFDLAMERKELFGSAMKTMNVLFKGVMEKLEFQTLPDIILQKILYNLSLRDLKKIKLIFVSNKVYNFTIS